MSLASDISRRVAALEQHTKCNGNQERGSAKFDELPCFEHGWEISEAIRGLDQGQRS